MFKLIFLDEKKCDKFIYVSWDNKVNDSDDRIDLDRSYAQQLCIENNESVLLQHIDPSVHLDRCNLCYLKPSSDEDYEIIVKSSKEIEALMLDQIRVLTINQLHQNQFNTITVWIESFSLKPIVLKILKVKPNQKNGLILTNRTRIVVLSAENQAKLDESDFEGHLCANDSSNPKINNVLEVVLDKLKNLLRSSSDDTEDSNQIVSLESNENSPLRPTNKCNHVSIPNFKLCRPLFLRIIIRNKLSKESENHFIARISAKYFQSNQVLHLGCHGIIMEKIDDTTNDSKLKWIDADRIGLERIQNPIEKFCMIFTVNSFQINQQNCSESFILIEPDDSCPDDSIVMNRNFISQRSLSFLSYINLKPIVLNNDKIKTKDSLAYTQVPIVEKVILVVLTKSIINENDELEISKELKKMMEKNSIIKFYHLFLYNGLIVQLCGKKFMTIQYPQGDKEIDESMFNKMVHEWFLIDQKTLVKVQQVELVQSILDGMKAIKFVEQSIKNSPVYSYDHVSRKTFAGYNDQLKRCLQSIERSFNISKTIEVFRSTSLLIAGSRGSGKTLLIEKILYELSHRNLIWSTITDCNEIKGKRVESLLKMFSKLFVQAVRFQPSILVFDNLDQICYSTGEENDIVSVESSKQTMPETVYCERVGCIFKKLLNTLRSLRSSTDFSKITIIATAESVDNLHPILRDSFVFDETIEIAELNNERKTEIIERILEKKINFLLSKQIQVDLKIDPKLISKGTKNFSIKNLINLIDLILQSAMIHWFNNDEDVAFSSQKNDCLSISNDHFEIALQKFNTFDVPKSDQKLQSGRFLTDLGGMFEIKSKLFDLISMQMKYPNLHKQLPTRLPNSFLLYGMPGTGKTVLVEALVNEFDLNFINVKGPELLSKYIGNSEQSVRRVFQQAEQMAPCVLFFDEFDSLAPRRGHDSTGVTDRVVNQMLTLMDGLEERAANIFIIAATSRPDLIDLALLRPGRFDQTIHCPMPDSSARMDILLVLCRRLSIDIDSIPFDQLVSSTENFSNADLQALLYNALIDVSKQTSLRLKTIYQSEIEKSTSTTKVIPSTIMSNENIDEDISNEFEKQQYQHRQQIISPPQLSVFSSKIEWKHILNALNQTKPSLSQREQNRFNLM